MQSISNKYISQNLYDVIICYLEEIDEWIEQTKRQISGQTQRQISGQTQRDIYPNNDKNMHKNRDYYKQQINKQIQQNSATNKKQIKQIQNIIITNERLQRYFPNLSTIQQIQNHHLKIFSMYQKSQLNPINSKIQVKIQQQFDMKMNLTNKITPQQIVKPKNSTVDNVNQFINRKSVFKPIVNQNKNNDKYQQNNKIINNNKINNATDDMKVCVQSNNNLLKDGSNSFSNNSMKPINNDLNNFDDNPMNFINKDLNNLDDNPMNFLHDDINTIIIDNKNKSHRDKTQFMKCACQGKYLSLKQLFQCQRCRYKYHFECLSLKQRKENIPKICHICYLQQQGINNNQQLIRPSIIDSYMVIKSNNTHKSMNDITNNDEYQQFPSEYKIKFTYQQLKKLKRIKQQQRSLYYICLKMLRIQQAQKIIKTQMQQQKLQSNYSNTNHKQNKQNKQNKIASIQMPFQLINMLFQQEQPMIHVDFVKQQKINKEKIKQIRKYKIKHKLSIMLFIKLKENQIQKLYINKNE